MLCPFCGAYSPKQCELEDETGGICPWEEADYDPDIAREDRIERDRLEQEEWK